VTIGGQEVFPAAPALAGSVAVVESVHQIKDIEADEMLKEVTVDEDHFLFILRMTGKHIGGVQLGRDGERFHLLCLKGMHLLPKQFAGETVMGGDGKKGLVMLLQPPQIVQLKESAGRIKVIDRRRDPDDRFQLAQEKVPH